GGAGQREFLVAKTITVGGATLDQRQGLQRLDGGARKNRRRHVADGQHRAAIGVGDRDGAMVPAFHQASAQNFDQNRVSHRRCSSGRATLQKPDNAVACKAPWVGSPSCYRCSTRRRSSSARWKR